MSEPFVLGVNYWPRRKAMYWWQDFDAGEVREEFATIASIGMSIVRIFLLWEDWMPEPDTVDTTCLDNLGVVCDIAHENGLQLDVTFFTGHMSGPSWAPGWMVDPLIEAPSPMCKQLVSGNEILPHMGYRNMFHDETCLNAARLLLQTVVTRYKDHPAIWMWNLGNEPDLFAWPHSHEDGKAWVKEMTDLIKSIDPDHNVTCGLHSANLHFDNGLRVNDVFEVTDVAVMHAYPMYLPWARHELDPDLVPYMCAIVSALCGKPTLAEEWGGCTNTPGKPSEIWEWHGYGETRTQFMASEEDLADYIEKVLYKLVEIGSTGAMLWCYADYVEELWDKPPCKDSKHERFFGLVRPDGTLKPHAEVIKKFAQTRPTVQPAKRVVNLDITPETFYEDPIEHLIRLYQDYLERYETT